MRTLVIDTATSACSVALFEGIECLASHYEVIGRGHAEHLIPFIERLPGQGHADKIAVNIGPGSFTGIRVGISAARALAFAWNVPCTGYGCLDIVAATATKGTAVDAIMNGGHGEFFFQQFDTLGMAISAPISVPMIKAAALSNAPVVAGDAADKLVQARGVGNAILCLPDARQWHLIANHTALPCTPFYGRAPDAKPSA